MASRHVLVVYVALLAGGFGAFLGWVIENPDAAAATGAATARRPGIALALLLYSFASSIGYVFPVLLGALAVTGEFRLSDAHADLPRRTAPLDRAARREIPVAVRARRGLRGDRLRSPPWPRVPRRSRPSGWTRTLDESDTWTLVGRGMLAMALWAAVGVGLGVLVTNQVAAIVIVIAFTQFLEPILRLAASLNEVTASIGSSCRSAASDALVGASFYNIASVGATELLEWWQGGLVLLAIGAVATVIGGATTWRRDVT